MAQVTVRVKLIKEFEVFCSGMNEEEVLDDIADQSRLDDVVCDCIYDNIQIVSGTYDEPEDEEEENDDDEN